MENICIFCQNAITNKKGHFSYIDLTCPNCGSYSITGEAIEDLPHYLEGKHKHKKHLISGFLRELSEYKLKNEVITSENYLDMLNSPKVPINLSEKIDKLLLYIHNHTNTFMGVVRIYQNQPAIAYAIDTKELENLLKALEGLKYIAEHSHVAGHPYSCFLTLEGLKRAEDLQRKHKKSIQCFVAMWFSDEMIDVFSKNISPAIIATGYKPLIISDKEHNDDICDHIIAEIRNSRFIIADFTGQRGGVYYEAGFAHGLGLPVIWTCRKDWFNTVIDIDVEVSKNGKSFIGALKQERKTHFDIEHNNFIIWESGKELQEKLINRINATII